MRGRGWHTSLGADTIAIADAEGLIRCLPGEDATNGFFVSCFVRRMEDEMEDGEGSEGKKATAQQPTSKKRKAEDADPTQADETAQQGGTTAPAKRKKKKKKAKVE